MLNINTFNNLVNLARNTALGADARISVSTRNEGAGATFAATETNVFSRLGERLFRTDDAKAAYRDVRAQLLDTLTALFRVDNEEQLPSAVRAAFVFGETACDRPLTQRRLTAVLTATASTLGYDSLADMQAGVRERHEDVIIPDDFDGYFKTEEAEDRALQDIGNRRSSPLAMKFEKALRDPAKAGHAALVLSKLKDLADAKGNGANELGSLVKSITNSLTAAANGNDPAAVARAAKLLATLPDFDPDDGKSLHALVKAFGHAKYIDKSNLVKVEVLDNKDYVDTIYSGMMKTIAANIQARVDQEPDLNSAQKKDLVAKMTNLVTKLSPFRRDFAKLSERRYDYSDVARQTDLALALDDLLAVALQKPDFNVKASRDLLAEMHSAADQGDDSFRLREDLEFESDMNDIKNGDDPGGFLAMWYGLDKASNNGEE